MADPNESNKKGMNTFADDIDRSSTLSELERIGQRAQRKGFQRTQLEDRIKSEGKLLNSLLEQGRTTPEFRDSPFYQEQTGELRQSIKGLRTKMNSMDTTARTRAESEASTYIGKQFGHAAINSQTSVLQRESAIQNRAFAMSGQTYDELQSKREDILADIRVRERQAQNEVKGMFTGRGEVNPERSAAIGVMMGGTRENIRELATINAAQTFQKASGQDPNSKIRNLAEMGQVANEMLSAESIAKEVQSGGVQISQGGKMGTVANEDVNTEIMTQARLLANALKELAEGAGKTDEELSKLRATADESAENMKKLEDARRAGAGGGGINYANLAMGAAGGFNALGGGAQAIMVNQRMQQMSNVAGFANIANQQYDMYQKARGGDIASQLALGQTDDAGMFGTEMSRATNTVTSLGIAAGAAQATAGGFQVAEGLKDKGTGLIGGSLAGTSGIATQQIITGGQNVLQGGVTAAVGASDLARGTSAGAAQIAGYQANMQARQAINAVGASQAQGLRNFYTDLDVAGQGLGSRSSEFITNAISDENMQNMADARMSPEQYAKLSAQGAEAMGSTFDGNQAITSRYLERGGFGSAQTNMGRMATLAQAGGNNPAASMQGVLEAAFSKSLDSSKALNMMVENTTAMAANTNLAASGIDVTGAASTLLASTVNPNMANREAALQQAITAGQLTQQITTDRSVSFSGMVNTAGIQKATGLSGVESILAQGMTIQELKALQGAGAEKAAQQYQNQGMNVNAANADDITNKLLREKQNQLVRDKGMALGVNTGEIADKMRAGTLTEAEKRTMGQAWNLGGGKGGFEEFSRQFNGVTSQNTKEGIDKAAAATSGGGPEDMKKQMDTLRTSGFKQMTEAAQLASDELKKFGGALKVFTDLQNKFEKGGVENEKEFSGAGAEMAKSFSSSTGLFKESVGKFDEAARLLADKVGLLSNGNPIKPQMINQKEVLDKKKGSN
jgi:hypothetical protein